MSEQFSIIPSLVDLCFFTVEKQLDTFLCTFGSSAVPNVLKNALLSRLCLRNTVTASALSQLINEDTTHISLAGCKVLTLESLVDVLVVCSKLKTLNLSNTGSLLTSFKASTLAKSGNYSLFECLSCSSELLRSKRQSRGATLTVLDLSRNAPFSEKALHRLLLCVSALSTLILDGTPLTTDHIATVAKTLPHIKRLSLQNCALANEALLPLSHLSSLVSLNLNHNHGLDMPTVVRCVLQLPALMDLGLAGSGHINYQDLRSISGGLPILQRVDLSHRPLTALLLDVFAERENSIDPQTDFRELTAITQLSLSHCIKMETDRLALVLTPLAGSLTSLDLGYTHITSENLLALAGRCPTLTHLNIACCARLTEHSLQRLFPLLPHLLSLDLSYCHFIMAGDATFKALVQHCLHLTTLNLTCVKDLKNAHVQTLLLGLPELRHLTLSGCSHFNEKAFFGESGCLLRKLHTLTLYCCWGIAREVVRTLRLLSQPFVAGVLPDDSGDIC
eukprot:GCRY01005542.1.p1 GENE.GCRY01005542.1~~GCRY01005542.1.p1  ORF type:complete len:505 (+),score=137.72 GCRY01005542.1:333-1847(+)